MHLQASARAPWLPLAVLVRCSAGAPPFQDVADDPAVTAIGLGVFFRSPHETMPDLILSRAETDNAIADILSLR